MEKRMYYLDNLKVFLTMLVLFHHTAITFGAAGSWYYVEETGITITAIVLTLFAAVNQTFFMGLFFFISAFFTPGSYEKKGGHLFIKDRLLRLGVPFLFYAAFIGPALIYYLHFRGEMTFMSFYTQKVLTLEVINIGPMWFVEALIYFALGYMLWRHFTKAGGGDRVSLQLPSNRVILLAALLTGCVSFLVRLFIPTGEEVLGLQLGYFSSYIILFIAGIAAFRYNWLEGITAQRAAFWLRLALIAIPILPAVGIAAGALEQDRSAGGLNIQALNYALWEPFVGFGICIFLLFFFNKHFNRTSPFLKNLSAAAYTVYIIHPPVVVFISLALRSFDLFPAIKFIITGLASNAACFALASLIIRLPYARRIL